MDGRQRSKAESEHTTDLDDGEIIDLTQVVENEDDSEGHRPH